MPGPVGIARVDIRCNTSSVTTGLDKVKTQTRAAMAQMKKDVNESNRTLAIMGETIGVGIPRHIRGFISQLPGVSTALSAAFSGVAIILVGKVILEVAEKVKKLAEAYRQMGEAAKRSADGWREQTGTIQASNDAMELSNAKLEAQIATLERKPANNLKVAVFEAQEQTDKLTESLSKAIEAESKLLEAHKVGLMAKYLGNAADNSGVAAKNAEGAQKVLDLSDARASATEALNGRGLDHGSKAYLDALAKINADYQTGLRKVTGEYSRYFRDLYNDTKRNDTAARAGYAASRNSPTSGTAMVGRPSDPTLTLMDASNASRFWRGQGTGIDLAQTNLGLQGTLHGLKGNPKGSGASSGNPDAAREKQATEQMELFNKYLEISETGHKRSLAEELDYINKFDALGENRNAMAMERNKVWLKLQEQNGKVDSGGSLFAGLGKIKVVDPEEIERARMEVARFNREMAKTRDEVAAKSIDWAEKTGQMSHYAAATALAALHTQEFNVQLGMLRAEHDQILMDRMTGKITQPAADEAFARNQNAQGTLIANRPLQSAEDKYNQQSQTAMQGMRDFWDAAIKEADNAAKTVNALFTQAMSEVNAQLVNGMMGKKMDWGKTFGSLASSTLSSGLKTGEGMIGKALGLGGKKGDSPMNPMYVSQVNALPGAAGGAGAAGGGGGIFGSLLKLFHIPGFAEGGYPSGLAMVGENGPELANFGGGGHVTSNSDVRAMLKGGGGSPVYNIDARGSNAADVQMRVKQAMQVTHAHAVQSSMQAQRELAARRPRSS